MRAPARSLPLPASVEAAPTRPLPLAACLFCLSFSTVLFTLAVFRLLSFFIMPSLFFDLLFIGFPVGAFLGARLFRPRREAFAATLWILLGAAAFSTVACLVCKNFDYLRAHLFEVEVPKLLGQIGVFTGLFIPYFGAYGLSEYVGYQVGRSVLPGRMGLVYALYLFGAAAAYLFLRSSLAFLGVSAMIAIALGGIALGAALLDRGGRRRAAGALALGFLALGVLPLGLGSDHPVERAFLHLYKGRSPQSSRDLVEREYARTLFQKWGKYSYCEIMDSQAERSLKGLYNDFFQWEYGPGAGFQSRSLGAAPLWFVPPGGSAAIIGAGGGRQVRYGQKLGVKRILALEIEPAVVEAVKGPLADRFDRVYQPGGAVEVRVAEARSYMEKTSEKFDLIYLPSVGGYPQMMLEPGNLIRTHEAYRTLRDRLTERGLLAIWYPSGLDPKLVLTDQYVRTLRALGMEVLAYEALQGRGKPPEEFLILAGRADPASPVPGVPAALSLLPELQSSPDPRRDLLRYLRSFLVVPSTLDPRAAGIEPYLVKVDERTGEHETAEVNELPVFWDPLFTPITDEKPFLAGNVRHVFSLEQVHLLFGTVGGVILAASLAVYVLLRRRGDPAIPGRPYSSLAGLSALIGANFLLLEHALVLLLFKELFVYYDSLVLGAIAFLILSGLGSILVGPRLRLPAVAAAVLCVSALFLYQLRLPPFAGLAGALGPAGLLLLFAPVAFVTGSFFPGVFELAARNPLGVFAMDAVGAAFGSLASFFIPLAFGFRVFFLFAAGVFLATAMAACLFHRRLEPAPSLPSRSPAGTVA